MFRKLIYTVLVCCAGIFSPVLLTAQEIRISNPKIIMTLKHGNEACITSLIVNGQKVISGPDGIYTSVNAGGVTYSSLHLKQAPVLVRTKDKVRINGISYGNENFSIKENWLFTISNTAISWAIERSLSKPEKVNETATPVFNFDSINTWEGAFQGYGGLAWFYLFNEKLCTYGVHSRSSDFWNSKTGTGLNITINAPGKNVAMKYTRTGDDRLAYTVSVSDEELCQNRIAEQTGGGL